MTANVKVQNVTMAFGQYQALRDITLDIESGEFVVLLGPSGCGKTTLLSILGGFLVPTSGEVLIGGKNMNHVSPRDRPTTTMFQDYALFPHMSLLDNVGFGLRMRGQSRKERDKKALAMLDMVGLEHAAKRRPHELSGGQRQRIALARALAVDPDVLLLDEPLGALDLKLRRQMQDELKQIQRRVGTTFVHVTHDQEEAMSIADKIVVMSGGHIEDLGAPETVYLRPKSLFSAGFMGEINQIPVTCNEDGVVASFGRISLPHQCKPGRAATLCIRPENIGANRAGLKLGRANLISSAFFGTHYRCHFALENNPECVVIAHMPQHAQPVVGEINDLFANDPIIINEVQAQTPGAAPP